MGSEKPKFSQYLPDNAIAQIAHFFQIHPPTAYGLLLKYYLLIIANTCPMCQEILFLGLALCHL